MVIHDVGKVIRREPIRLEQDEVLLGILLEGPVDGVLELGAPEPPRVQAHDVALALGCTAVRLGALDMPAGARVVGWLAGLVELELLRVELLKVAEAAVGVVAVEEYLDVLFVDIETLRLRGGSVGEPDAGKTMVTCL